MTNEEPEIGREVSTTQTAEERIAAWPVQRHEAIAYE